MKRILVYYPFNRYTIPIDIPLVELIKNGNKVLLYCNQEYGDLQSRYESQGIEIIPFKKAKFKGKLKYIQEIFTLIGISKKYDVDYIFSHLQPANLVSSIANYFTSSIVYNFRHHFYYEHLLTDNSKMIPNKNMVRLDKLINKFSKRIIVPSINVKNAIVQKEKINPNKIQVIPYRYNFTEKINSINVENARLLRQKYASDILAIIISRLIPYKRHILAFNIVKKLKEDGINIKLLVMDDAGSEYRNLKRFVEENNLTDSIYFLGYKQNVLEYLSASDVLIHPSLTETSSSAVKEAGILEKIVFVCKDVGDFNEYIINNVNGYSFPASDFEECTINSIKNILTNKSSFSNIGRNLKTEVLSRFQMQANSVKIYQKLINNKID